ncbi:MAG TPA: M28 family metallopeptidase [Bradyrhizobium sp.]|jgi:hypothetical protein|nr:M28 family metallopeptidase [Bradyrhizobium sp.]
MGAVKFAVCQTRLATAQAPADPHSDLAAIAGVSSITFGEDVVYFGTGASWDQFRDGAGSARARLAFREHPESIQRENLHVVVQKGRLFQLEHPEVSVLVDKGRFLLVDLEPKDASKLGKSDIPCYSVQPLSSLPPMESGEGHRRVFEAARRPAALVPDPTIQALVDRISRQTYEADLTHLVAFNTRNSTSAQFAAACDFVDGQLAALGYVTSRQTIQVSGSPSENVIALRDGSGPASRETVLVSAHLDSINLQGNIASPAPGADDDGSGSAGVIEIARALKDHQGVHDLQLVLFGGEEQGLFGSKQFVATLTEAKRAKLRAVVHMDMIASLNSASPTVLLEGAPVSQAVIDGLSAAASTYTGLAVQTSLNPFNSDHVPFIRKNVPAVLTIEGTDDANDAIHSPRDTLDRINFDLALEILRMNTAFVVDSLIRP